mmetsp:Transcript_15082/g.33230  ORF Transcript_15082/g.33230 Transcript_15082/m.33230 type:complete len:211 (+) Transcript_15082:382-1014(+)
MSSMLHCVLRVLLAEHEKTLQLSHTDGCVLQDLNKSLGEHILPGEEAQEHLVNLQWGRQPNIDLQIHPAGPDQSGWETVNMIGGHEHDALLGCNDTIQSVQQPTEGHAVQAGIAWVTLNPSISAWRIWVARYRPINVFKQNDGLWWCQSQQMLQAIIAHGRIPNIHHRDIVLQLPSQGHYVGCLSAAGWPVQQVASSVWDSTVQVPPLRC